MAIFCKETFVPTTDNTPLDCEDYTNDVCINIQEGYPFIATRDNLSLKDFNDKLIQKLILMNSAINIANGGGDLSNVILKRGEEQQSIDGSLVIENAIKVTSVEGQDAQYAGITFENGRVNINADDGIFLQGAQQNKGKFLSVDLITGEIIYSEAPQAVQKTSQIINDGEDGQSEYIDRAEFNRVLQGLSTPPTYTQPTTTLTVPQTQVEIGSNIDNITITINYNKQDGGDPTAFRLYEGGLLLSQNQVTQYSKTNVQADVVFYAEVDYAQGPIKNDSLGIPRPDEIVAAGTITTPGKTIATTVVEFIYFGAADSLPTSESEYKALPQTANKNTSPVTLITGDTKLNFIIAIPIDKNIVSIIDITNANFNITSDYPFLENTTITSSDGTVKSYKVYASQIGIPYQPSANHVITLS